MILGGVYRRIGVGSLSGYEYMNNEGSTHPLCSILSHSVACLNFAPTFP